MTRPWHVWALFGLCLAVALAALGWVSLKALELDRAQAEAERYARLQENVRLALWRMDSALAPIIAEENARPYFVYSAFYPAERAYTSMFAPLEKGDVLIPSPLLSESSPYVLLHFQLGPDGAATSPQVPTSNMRDLAETGYVTVERLTVAEERLAELKTLVSRDALLQALDGEEPGSAASWAPAGGGGFLLAVLLQQVVTQAGADVGQQAPQGQRDAVEWEMRQQRAVESLNLNRRGREGDGRADVREEPLRPVWVGEALVLARCISVEGTEYVQGCWLDWPAIRQWLVGEVADLLPEAGLMAVAEPASGDHARMLAALPVRLLPGIVSLQPEGPVSAIGPALLAAWGCVLLAAAAVAVLLRGAVVLSERRGAFVSAVTHEMRTPLTTFRMYTEMLAGGMVPEERRREYVDTLEKEAGRLGHLVENVLAYAELERDSTRGRIESIAVSDLLDRVGGRLVQRAEQADMTLQIERTDEQAGLCVRADPSAVEQILFNLVDNACKYAISATDRTIHLEVRSGEGCVEVRVRDHGPGIVESDRRNLFRPFRKSARDAAGSAPGVGLGLALSRRLARSMGGGLSLDAGNEHGACFTLLLSAVPC